MIPKPSLYRAVRPLLFSLPADQAHELGKWFLKRWLLWSLASGPSIEGLECELLGMRLKTPIGLAAGLDKDGEMVRAMKPLGFGFTTVGSIRVAPHPGNPRPWLVRYPKDKALVNSLGLPSKGLDYVAKRLEVQRGRCGIPIIASLVGYRGEEVAAMVERLMNHVDAFELNVSCPNGKGSPQYTDLLGLEELLLALNSRLGEHHTAAGSPPPLLLKLPPPLHEEHFLEMVRLALRRGIKGFVAINALPVAEEGVGMGRGGLSGSPLLPKTKRAVSLIRREIGDRVPIIAVGGAMRGEDAFDLLALGANAIGVLTALIYRGPLAAKAISRELARVMRERGFSTIEELVGYREGKEKG